MIHYSTYESHKIYYRVSGKGHPVVFLHGFLENVSIWETIEGRLSDQFLTVVIDLPGHGKSDCFADECSMAFMASGVQQVISDLNISHPIIFGHSMGGYVGLELIRQIEAALVLVHSNFWSDSEHKKGERDRLISVVDQSRKWFIKQAIPNLFYPENIKNNEAGISQLISEAEKMTEHNIKSATLGMRNRLDHTALLGTKKIEIIQGQYDPVIPLNMMMEKVKKSGFEVGVNVLENCGHMGFMEQPELFLDSVMKCCNELKSEILSQNYNSI